jgi:two-component system response regulator (stage 0 sporulation protein A)
MAIDAHNKFRVVLVDDDKNFCEFIGLSLAQEFDIKCYNDPYDALSEIKKDIPDLVLLDIAMPKLNGFGLLEYLKKDLNEKAPKIIFMTALEYTDDGIKIDEEYVRNIGADGLIRKEEDTKTIIQKIKQFLSNN